MKKAYASALGTPLNSRETHFLDRRRKSVPDRLVISIPWIINLAYAPVVCVEGLDTLLRII